MLLLLAIMQTNQISFKMRKHSNAKSRFIWLLIPLLFSSCVGNKKLIYLQKESDAIVSQAYGDLVPINHEEYRVQLHDVLDVNVKTTSTDLNEILNVENQYQMRNIGGLNSGDVFYMNGYTVDSEGQLDLPLIGRIKVVGMTLQEAKDQIKESYQKIINKDNLFVRVRIGGFRYSALGEFNSPGKFTILQNKVTILEAIANAGDLTSFANRNSIILMRYYPDGIRSYTVNLLSENLTKSEFFFLQQNDILYARPMKVKPLGIGVTFSQSLDAFLSIITVILLYVNVTR